MNDPTYSTGQLPSHLIPWTEAHVADDNTPEADDMQMPIKRIHVSSLVSESALL